MTSLYVRTGVLAFAVLLFVMVFGSGAGVSKNDAPYLAADHTILPIVWGDTGIELVHTGVIDPVKWRALYGTSLTAEEETLLSGTSTDKLVMTKENASYLLNLFWAVGLANKNQILEDKKGMMNPAYGGADHFASTGGWTLSTGSPMDHYDHHLLFALTSNQQKLVEKVSAGIYRPCCDNPTSFPDCNHGMAMLGLLEMMASQGATEQQMWKAALAVNEYWFPDTYKTIAVYMKHKGISWADVNPQEVLGAQYSSASGYAKIAAQVTQPKQQSAGSCGV
ncbi:MAG TPA: hypothetical protein VMV38_00685 [Candidatus Paceibacterota bacterium]|nr:hypothetical protein [Candidatus Paceibacterota bacterium]